MRLEIMRTSQISVVKIFHHYMVCKLIQKFLFSHVTELIHSQRKSVVALIVILYEF
jgi:hypothetical protein